jgi:branched-chain amino acid transport system substrate-binding protein
MKRLVPVLAVGALLLGLSGAALAADSIKIGIPLPLTGPQAKFGEIEKNSYLMALDEINARGLVKGANLEFDIQDSQGKPDVARAIVEKFIGTDKYPVIVGAYSSAESKQVAAVADEKKIPYLCVTGAADDITQKGSPWVFRLNQSSEQYPEGVVGFLNAVVKPQKVAILFENTDFGTSSSKAFEAVCVANKWEVVLKEGYEPNALDFKPLLQKVKAVNPDVIYMVSYLMDATQLMKDASALRVEPKVFIGGGAGFTLPEFPKNAQKAAEFVYSATLWAEEVKYPGARKYFDDYKAKYKTETEYHGAQAYAAAFVIADVLTRAKAFTAEDIRAAMAATDLMTVYGPVKFQAFGKYTNQNKLPTLVIQWVNGQAITVWPEEYAAGKYVYPVPAWKDRK